MERLPCHAQLCGGGLKHQPLNSENDTGEYKRKKYIKYIFDVLTTVLDANLPIEII